MLSALAQLDRPAAREQRALWADGDPDPDHEASLTARGWQTRTCKAPELARRYGRGVPPAFDPDHGGSDAGGLLTARLPGQQTQRSVCLRTG
jgi:hypothetical protein